MADGLVVISTRQDLDAEKVVRVYNVGSLVGRNPERVRIAGADLARVLTATVEPESWSGHGDVGTAESFNDLLIVRQSRRVHRLVESFLEGLLAAQSGTKMPES